MTNSQTWDPERYARNARFVAEMGLPLLDLLQPQPGERVLDLGCGDGALTEKLAGLGCSVVGVDASPEQVAAARARGLDARVADAQALAFDGEFDAVFSNAALHWMSRVDDVVKGVYRALRPGGRFVAECGGQGNIAAIRRSLHAALARRGVEAGAVDPWHFLGPEEYEDLLQTAGFRAGSMTLFDRPTPLPGDIADWLATFAESFLLAVPEVERPALVAEVRADLRPVLCDSSGQWTADYVRLRFRADKPGD